MGWMRAAAAGLLAVVCLGAAGRAVAGEYHVYSCRTPAGDVAPVDGWTSYVSGSGGIVEDSCKSGGALVAALGDGSSHEVEADRAAWTFSPSLGMDLVGARLWRAGDADGGWGTNATYEFWLAGPSNELTASDAIESCVAEFGCLSGVGTLVQPQSQSNLILVAPENLDGDLYASVSCGGSAKFTCPSGKGDANGYAAVVYLYAADLTLEQASQPTATNVAGELATDSTLTGTADLSFDAADSGSGVYQAVFSVDGVEVGRTLIDENGGRCRDVGGTSDGLPAFLYLRPCPASVSADLPFDTTTLSDGTHHLLVAVIDAAGNSTVVLDRKIDVVNHPSSAPVTTPSVGGANGPVVGAANGTPASSAASLVVRWSSTTHSSLTARFGAEQTVTGRLLAPGGAPVAGAVVQAQFLPAALGARPRQLANCHTGADGRFSLRLPRSLSSGRLTLSYSARGGQVAPDVTAVLTLTVPASLSLRVTPHSSHAGGTIHFAGALHGVALPHSGKQLVLEARSPGGAWRQFQVLDTGPRGSFRASYRFRLPGPVTYQFRALCPHEADFPYGAGASNVVGVRER